MFNGVIIFTKISVPSDISYGIFYYILHYYVRKKLYYKQKGTMKKYKFNFN